MDVCLIPIPFSFLLLLGFIHRVFSRISISRVSFIIKMFCATLSAMDFFLLGIKFSKKLRDSQIHAPNAQTSRTTRIVRIFSIATLLSLLFSPSPQKTAAHFLAICLFRRQSDDDSQAIMGGREREREVFFLSRGGRRKKTKKRRVTEDLWFNLAHNLFFKESRINFSL